MPMEDGRIRRIQFLIRQRDCPVRGENLEKAQESHRFLCRRFPVLGDLVETQTREAGQFIYSCLNRPGAQSPPRNLLVVTDAFSYWPDSRFEGFLAAAGLHLVTRLWRRNPRLVNRIATCLA